MRIIRLEIENQKAIKCFNLDANGNNIEIAGPAGTGKTTAINALWDILSRGKDVLTHGEKKGAVRVSIGDETGTHYIAERVTTPSKSTVTLYKMLGAKALPMDMKDFEAMLSKLSVNPHKIKDMKPTERIKTLLAAAECDIDLEALDAEIEEAEQDRLLAGRAANNSKPVEVPEKEEPVSVSELITKRDAVQEKNQKTRDVLHELDDLKDKQAADEEELGQLSLKVKQLQHDIELRKVRIDKGNEWEKTVDIVETTDLDQQIADAEQINKRAAIYEQAKKDLDNFNMLQAMKKEADDKVKELRESKKQALGSVQWPLDGIAIEDGEITYNGCLLDNLGESEQMLVTSAIARGDIEKHEFKVVRLDGIESMSPENYEQLKTMFNEIGVQVLSTRVSRGDEEPNEIVITEGEYNG